MAHPAPALTHAAPADDAVAAPRPAIAIRTVAALAAAKLLLHLTVLAVTPFGVHRDEFLYFSMGRHLRLFRMDFPPLIAILANAARALFGDSLASVRVFPAIEGTLLVVLAALLARELGGGRFAQGLAALCVLAGALWQRSATLFQPVVLDQLWWALGLFALLRIGRAHAGGDAALERRWWLLFGLFTGLGLLTKFSILFFGLSALAAIVLTPLRRSLRTPWPWTAAAIALLIGSPSVIGQVALDYPVLGQMRDLQQSQLEHVSWAGFITEQPLMIGPVSFLVALAGAAGLLVRREWRWARAAGLTCVLAFLLLLVLHGKAYYIGPIYPLLLAAGAVLLESARRPRVAPLLRWGAVTGIAIVGLVGLPLGVPLMGREATAAWAVRIGAAPALRTNRGTMERLPQDFADMLGWEEQSRAVARALASLTPEERREAVLVGDNYGEAGALEFFSERYGFPRVVSPAGSFWFFGPGDKPGRVAVVVGDEPEDIAGFARDVRLVERVLNPWGVEEERDVEIVVARDPKTTLQAIWPGMAGRN